MAKRAFLDDNRGRDYPFLKGTSIVPITTILACGFVIGPNTGFIAGQHNVALTKVKREFGRIWFYFTCNAPGLLSQEIIFSRLENAPDYALEYSDSSSIQTDDGEGSVSESFSDSTSISYSQSSSQSASQSESENDIDTINVCGYVDDFRGFLITGSMEDLLEVLPLNGNIEGYSPVEPALLQDLSNTYIRSVNIANIDRTRYVAPAGCDGDDDPGDRNVFVNSTCIQGKVVFTPGVNANVSQNNFINSITFSAVVGAGDGEPCEQIPIYPGEAAPSGSSYLEGGPSCNEVIRSISGASGPKTELNQGNGISISYDTLESKIIIDVNLKALSSCEDTILIGEALYDSCHHEAGLPGMGPDGGRGVTELYLPAMEFSGLGLFAAPGSRVGIGLLTLPKFTTTGGGGSSGGFSKGFSGYGALSLPILTSSGAGNRPFNIHGPGAVVFPKFTISGSGTGTFTPPPFSAIGSGGVNMAIMAAAGEGEFYPYVEPPPIGDDIHFDTPITLIIVVGKGGTTEDTVSEPSVVWRGTEAICYAPPGLAGFSFEGGKGGGRGTTNQWPSWYTYGGINNGVRNDGGDGALCPILDNFYRGGGGGGAAGQLGDGHPGGQPFIWMGGDGRDDAPGSYPSSGQGADSELGAHIATIPGGGGAGVPNHNNPEDGADGMVAFSFDTGSSIVEVIFDIPGVHQLYLGDYPGVIGGFIECWGGGGIGGGFEGNVYNGGGGGAYGKTIFHIDY